MINNLKFLFSIFSKQQKKRLFLLFILLILGMSLEVIGLGILVPLLNIILDQSKIDYYTQEIEFLSFLTDFSQYEIMTVSLSTILFVYLFKAIFLVALNYYLNKFNTYFTSGLSNKIFGQYLNSGYEFHLRNESSDLVKNLQLDVNHCGAYFSAFFSGFIDLFLSIAVLFTLMFIEPLGASVIFLFLSLMAYVFYVVTKLKLKTWSSTRAFYDKKITATFIESLGSIRDLLIFSKQDFFLSSLKKLNLLKANISSKQITLKQIPRYYLEFIAICGLVVLIFSMLLSGKKTEDLITITGIFVAATFRLLPSINKILQSLQTIKFYDNSILIIKKRLQEYKPFLGIKEKVKFKRHIVFDNVSYKYPDNEEYIIENVSLKLLKNQTIGIVGTSGVGKSTFVDLIVGLICPNEGMILVDEKHRVFKNQQWIKKIGYVSQNINIFESTLEANIAFGIPKESFNKDSLERAINDAELSQFVNQNIKKHEMVISEKGKNLSGGQRQRIGIARALYREPEIIIFDEATSALDNNTEEKILDSIQKYKHSKTIIIISHRSSSLSMCDVVYELKDKNLIKL